MKTAWLVVRKQKGVEDRYWVCEEKNDALIIAKCVVRYWRERYPTGDVFDELHGGCVFMHQQEDAFTVYVIPVGVREKGETRA